MCQFRIFVADTVASELDQVVATRKADVETVEASSPIVLDDINGDGRLDLVQVIWMQERVLVFAVQASTGMDLDGFRWNWTVAAPEFHHPAQDVHQKLLVDLHSDQAFVSHYLRRNGTSWEPVGLAELTLSLARAFETLVPRWVRMPRILEIKPNDRLIRPVTPPITGRGGTSQRNKRRHLTHSRRIRVRYLAWSRNKRSGISIACCRQVIL